MSASVWFPVFMLCIAEFTRLFLTHTHTHTHTWTYNLSPRSFCLPLSNQGFNDDVLFSLKTSLFYSLLWWSNMSLLH